ncbi:putative transferase At1g60990, chloroplastic isoform X2 [Telopea speciosissima]|uniref:putative transferase At1g60990, chloroplastic isoform X2 n=1 Tax=Telopea speciosissima TaxID=54955 RepID=UPI001CC59733|nr:putative transferase At1g60990, chloroplastic isoform X2 [Telopea speciosissima]
MPCVGSVVSCCSSAFSLHNKHRSFFFSQFQKSGSIRTQKRLSFSNAIILNIFSSATTTAVAASPFDFAPPPIDNDFLEMMAELGANISEDGTIETFGNDDIALRTVDDGVVSQEKTGFSFFTTKAQQILKASVKDRYIFFADKVEVQDITKQTCFFVVIGPKSNQVMEELGLGDLVGKPYGTHVHYSVHGMPITVGVGSVIFEEGFSLLLSPAAAGSVWNALVNLGVFPMGANAFERLRILQGRPFPGKELTNEFNVLEAGLWNSVSLNKGCYKGQETISRLITYDGVKQKLWGIHLPTPAEPGSLITVNGKKIGKLTSCAAGRKDSEYVGLGYIKKNTVSAGDEVNIGETLGIVVDVPFLARQTPLTRSISP